jgi:membrane fusion protein, adhesin transport system
MSKDKLGIMHDTSQYTLSGTKFFSHIILWSIVLFIIVFVVWAKFAILDEVAAGEGKVIPSSQIQVIQNLEGGIVEKIFVKEGEMVGKGQMLMELEDTLFLSKLNESEKQLEDLKIELTRLEAEINGKPLVFDKEIQESNPSLVAAEISLHKARESEKKQLADDIGLATQELKLTAPLVAKGAASKVEVLRLQRTVSELQGKLYAFNSKTLQRYNEAKGEYVKTQTEMMAAKDRVTRTIVRSPVKGIIKQLKINTLGGVIKPGMDIMEIVPVDDTLLIEAKIKPEDIGFIHPKQKAMVKISAYDFSIYGGLKGTVEQISADTIIDEESERPISYYVIRVRTQKNYLGTEAKPLYIIPGMQATVDILTGEKSVLDYLLKPLLKTKQKALRER